MVLKECVVCGKQFNARVHNAKVCSDECRKAHIKQYQKQYHKQYHKQYYQENAEYKKEYQKQYYRDNAEHIKQYKKQYYKDNAEYYKQYDKQYRKGNAEHIKQYQKQYYQEKLSDYYNQLSEVTDVSEDELRKIIPKWFVKREAECVGAGKSYFMDFVCAALDRANGRCELTGKKTHNLNVHHLDGYNWFIEGRTDIDNAIVLDADVHRLFHKIYGNGQNTRAQFDEFKEKYKMGDLDEIDY